MIVSIIIPTYNNIDKLPRALSSIEEIDFPIDRFEVIVIDDGSSDGTDGFVQEFKDNTKLSIEYFYQENRRSNHHKVSL